MYDIMKHNADKNPNLKFFQFILRAELFYIYTFRITNALYYCIIM